MSMLYPVQNDRRNLLDLSGFWSFRLDPNDIGHTSGWSSGLEEARTIAVPASWNELYEDTRDYFGVAWYEQRFYAPQGWQGERVFVRIGSANYAATVWLNGAQVGEHQGGHLPFACDITGQVDWQGENRLLIRVDAELTPTRVPPGNVRGGAMGGMMNSYPSANFDFFPYAGLQRPVVLFSQPMTAITDVTVVTDINGADGIVTVHVEAECDTGVGAVHLSGQGRSWTAALTFDKGQATAHLELSAARFWCPDDPYLYQLAVTLDDENATVDRYSLEIGIRTIAVRGTEILLNGKPIALTGFGRHEDFPIHGRGLNMPLLIRDFSLLKWVGANSFRTSHYPYSEEQMMLADREGILVVDEIPAVGLFFEDGPEGVAARLKQCRQQLDELIRRDKNHASVIMWSVANEPLPPHLMQRFAGGDPPPLDPATTAFFAQLIDQARAQDATRPVTLVGLHGCPHEWLALSDVIFINRYFGWYVESGQLEAGFAALDAELDELFAALGKPIVLSEFGADTVAGMHSNPPEMFSEEYQVAFLRGYLEVAARKEFVVGLHVWNFADFKTGQGIMRVGGLNLKGVFTRERRPKMAAHFLRAEWATKAE